MAATKKNEVITPESKLVCGFCAGAPSSSERELSHLRCTMESCRCRHVAHRPNELVREAQMAHCHTSQQVCVTNDPGLHPSVDKWASRYTEMGTSARVAGVLEARAATLDLKDASDKELRIYLLSQRFTEAQLKKADRKKLIAFAVGRRADAAARAVVEKRDEKQATMTAIRKAATERQEERATMATATKAPKTTKTTSKTNNKGAKVSKAPTTVQSFNEFKVGGVVTVTADYTRPAGAKLSAVKVKAGEKLVVKEIHSTGRGAQLICVRKGENKPMEFGASRGRVSATGTATKAPAAKKAPAKKATTKAPAKAAKRAPAKRTTKKTTAAARRTRKVATKRTR